MHIHTFSIRSQGFLLILSQSTYEFAQCCCCGCKCRPHIKLPPASVRFVQETDLHRRLRNVNGGVVVFTPHHRFTYLVGRRRRRRRHNLFSPRTHISLYSIPHRTRGSPGSHMHDAHGREYLFYTYSYSLFSGAWCWHT